VSTEQSPAPQFPPAAESSELIEFERADVISPMIYPSRPRLVVSGRKPWANMAVSLVPCVYARPPDYWAIRVVGTMPQIGQPAIVPYVVGLELGDTIGSAGIEVVGANKTEQIDVQKPDEPAVAAGTGEPPPGTGTAGTAEWAEAGRPRVSRAVGAGTVATPASPDRAAGRSRAWVVPGPPSGRRRRGGPPPSSRRAFRRE